MAEAQDIDVDNIIEQLLTVRGSRPGRQVNLTEAEIRWLCIKSREIFTVQPVLLELEAPIKICGMESAILMDSDEIVVPNFFSNCYFIIRWYPRPVLWFIEIVWIWRVSTDSELSVSRVRNLFVFI